jgi:hypothetical protein
MSNYVWRGIRLSEGPVYQSSIGATSGGLSLNVWENFDFDTAKFNETDVTASYSHTMKGFNLEAGWIHYGIRDQRDSDELYAGLGADCLLKPSLKVFFDINSGKGAFLQASTGHSVSLSPRFSLDLKASMGIVFRNSFMGTPDSEQEFTGFHNAELLVASPIKLGKGWEIKLQAGVSAPLSRNARQAIINSSVCRPGRRFCNGSILYGGASLAYSF